MLQSSPSRTANYTLSANWSLKPTRQVTSSSRKMGAMKEKHPFKGPWTMCCGFYTTVSVICFMNLCNCYLASVDNGRSFDYAFLMRNSFSTSSKEFANCNLKILITFPCSYHTIIHCLTQTDTLTKFESGLL